MRVDSDYLGRNSNPYRVKELPARQEIGLGSKRNDEHDKK